MFATANQAEQKWKAFKFKNEDCSANGKNRLCGLTDNMPFKNTRNEKSMMKLDKIRLT